MSGRQYINIIISCLDVNVKILSHPVNIDSRTFKIQNMMIVLIFTCIDLLSSHDHIIYNNTLL